MKGKRLVEWIAFVLIVIGAVNWGLVGLVGLNLVEALTGAGSIITKLLYDLIGASGIVALFMTAKKI